MNPRHYYGLMSFLRHIHGLRTTDFFTGVNLSGLRDLVSFLQITVSFEEKKRLLKIVGNYFSLAKGKSTLKHISIFNHSLSSRNIFQTEAGNSREPAYFD